MPRFIVEETLACWVTFKRVVEADSESEALEAFNEGEGDEDGQPEIGDCLDGYNCEQRIVGRRVA